MDHPVAVGEHVAMQVSELAIDEMLFTFELGELPFQSGIFVSKLFAAVVQRCKTVKVNSLELHLGSVASSVDERKPGAVRHGQLLRDLSHEHLRLVFGRWLGLVEPQSLVPVARVFQELVDVVVAPVLWLHFAL